MRTDLNLRMLDLARFHIGVLEAGGANRGPMVEAFQKAVDGKAQGEPWCMAFVQYLIDKSEEVHGGRCKVPRTEHCLTFFRGARPENRISMGFRTLAQPGDIAIWQHGETTNGHCGVVSEIRTRPSGEWYFLSVEGNTGPGVGVVREGDGVYLRERPFADVGAMKLLGFVRVF